MQSLSIGKNLLLLIWERQAGNHESCSPVLKRQHKMHQYTLITMTCGQKGRLNDPFLFKLSSLSVKEILENVSIPSMKFLYLHYFVQCR